MTETQHQPTPATETPPKPDRTWSIILGLFLTFWIMYLLIASPRLPEPIDLDAPSKPADYNWTLHDLDGNPVKFTKYAGKGVFLNIWATNCAPCVVEMPSIARLAANPILQGKNLAFVCVATDDEIDVVRRYVKGKNWPMTILQADKLPGVFLTDGIPATFIIAPDGRVVSEALGGQEWDGPETVESLLAVAAISPKPPAIPPPVEPPAA